MKRKVYDLREWARVTEHAQTASVQPGHVIVDFHAHTVIRPLDVPTPGAAVLTRVLDSGYRWVRAHPRSGPDRPGYAVTMHVGADARPVQYYIDLHGGEGLHDSGLPWHDDLYLDVIGRPAEHDPFRVQAAHIIDGDDLEEAVAAGLVTPEVAERTWAHAREIETQLLAGSLPELTVLREYLGRDAIRPPVA